MWKILFFVVGRSKLNAQGEIVSTPANVLKKKKKKKYKLQKGSPEKVELTGETLRWREKILGEGEGRQENKV